MSLFEEDQYEYSDEYVFGDLLDVPNTTNLDPVAAAYAKISKQKINIPENFIKYITTEINPLKEIDIDLED